MARSLDLSDAPPLACVSTFVERAACCWTGYCWRATLVEPPQDPHVDTCLLQSGHYPTRSNQQGPYQVKFGPTPRHPCHFVESSRGIPLFTEVWIRRTLGPGQDYTDDSCPPELQLAKGAQTESVPSKVGTLNASGLPWFSFTRSPKRGAGSRPTFMRTVIVDNWVLSCILRRQSRNLCKVVEPSGWLVGRILH